MMIWWNNICKNCRAWNCGSNELLCVENDVVVVKLLMNEVVKTDLMQQKCYAQSVKWKKNDILTTSEISYLYRLWKIHKHDGPQVRSCQWRKEQQWDKKAHVPRFRPIHRHTHNNLPIKKIRRCLSVHMIVDKMRSTKLDPQHW